VALCQLVFATHHVNIFLHQLGEKVWCCRRGNFVGSNCSYRYCCVSVRVWRKKERRTRSRLPTSWPSRWSHILHSAVLWTALRYNFLITIEMVAQFIWQQV